MNYWLMKSEPSTWSWDDQLAKGEDGEGWDGVRNYQASNNMKAMEIGDLAFFFHSVNEKEAVGIVKICETYHPDPTDATGRLGMFDVKAFKPMVRPLTLAEIKGDERLADIALVRQVRLSVTPISAAQWDIVMQLGETSL